MLNNENESLGPLTKESEKSVDQEKIFFLLCCFGPKLNSDLSVEKSRYHCLPCSHYWKPGSIVQTRRKSNPLLPQPLSSRKGEKNKPWASCCCRLAFSIWGSSQWPSLETKLTLLTCRVHIPMQPYHLKFLFRSIWLLTDFKPLLRSLVCVFSVAVECKLEYEPHLSELWLKWGGPHKSRSTVIFMCVDL